jgi:hypothetical protein
MNRVCLVLLAGAPLIAACGTTNPVTQPQLNLDRPVDIAFACYGELRIATGHAPPANMADPKAPMAQPARSCELRSKLPPEVRPGQDAATPEGQAAVGDLLAPPAWFGFILQSTTGSVAISRWDVKSPSAFRGGNNFVGGDVDVLDADSRTPGKNTIVIGERPVGIATDRSGCYVVAANAGTCDLSTLEVNSVVDNDALTTPKLSRIPIKNKMGETILPQPAAIVAEPGTSNPEEIGKACEPTPTGMVYVAYPSCHLVAGVNASTGIIESAIRIGLDGTATVLADVELNAVSCKAECAIAAPAQQGRPPQPGQRPVALALEPGTRRLAIGSDDSNVINVIDLDASGRASATPSPISIALENPAGTLGVSAIALSPVVGLGGTQGVNNDADAAAVNGKGQYVYAVASDGTVRVADVLDAKRECETQADMPLLRRPPYTTDIKLLQCLPLASLPGGTLRRPGARGPGIELPTDAVPISVAFIRGEPRMVPDTDATKPPVVDPATRREAAFRLRGVFAVITSTSGVTYVANVDDDGNGDDLDDSNNRVRSMLYASDVFDAAFQQRTAPVLLIAHQLRDSINKRGSDTTVERPDLPNPPPDMLPEAPMNLGVRQCVDTTGIGIGGPRATALPARITAGGAIDGTKTVNTDKTSLLPTLRQFECIEPKTATADEKRAVISELGLAAVPAERDLVFPDLRSLASDETWSLTWEGRLSLDNQQASRDGPIVRSGQLAVDRGMRLTDAARPFCDMGVEPYDIVDLRGCDLRNGDGDCPASYTCFKHPDSRYLDPATGASVGSCMLKTEASQFANACRDFLISRRSYTVLRPTVIGKLVDSAQVDTLFLTPRKHVLRTTPVDGCVDDNQCKQLATIAAGLAVDVQPRLVLEDTTRSWACQLDETRAPVNTDPASNKRCVQTCKFHSPASDGQDRDADCDVGLICVGATPANQGVCMESIVPPQSCVNAPQRFSVRAGDAFTVIGTTSGYVHPIVVNTAQAIDPSAEATSCVPRPELRTQIGRVPLKAPACDPTADPITGKLPSGLFEPNPCSLTADHAELVPVYAPTPADPCVASTKVIATRAAPAIQFRNRGMRWTLVDPWITPDRTCVGDRAGLQAKVPIAFQGYQLTFRQIAGYLPLTLGIAPAFPIKVVQGPTNSFWVMDAGDNLDPNGVSTRGKVFRVETSALGVVNTLF